MKSTFSSVIVGLLFVALGVASDRNIVVKTRDGAVKGVKEGSSVVWKGLPFAAPPVGNNRWKDPQPVKPWSGVRNANQFAPGCSQLCKLPPLFCPSVTSEDCLYLNVYAPLKESSTLLPVMFFIMGGAFQYGDASCPIYRGGVLSNNTETIVVVINYRLGPLGFLNVGGSLNGNYGLKDQINAMKWVQANIKAFGGDPTKVTIFGESAGAMSIGIHLTSPATQGLYSKAIMQSNPLGIPYRSVKNAEEIGEVFAALVGCAFQNEDCLRSKPIDVLIKAGEEMPPLPDIINVNGTGISLSWMPTVDYNIVMGQPLTLFSQGKFRKIPTMMGTNLDEGIMFVMMAQRNMRMINAEYIAVVSAAFGKHAFRVLEMYPPPLNPLHDCRNLLSKLITDAVFACPNRKIALALSKEVKTHLYQFTYAPPVQTIGPAYCTNMVCHGEELPFIYQTVPNATPLEIRLSNEVVKYWGSIANSPTGSPNLNSKLEWPAFDANTQFSMKFDDPVSVVSGLKKDQCDFWDSIGYDV